MELTLGGLLGAIAGAILGVANYAMLAPSINAKLRAAAAENKLSRKELEERLSLTRRSILGFAMLVFMSGGYWLGTVLAR